VPAGFRINEGRIKVDHQIVLVNERRDQFIAEAEIEREPWTDFKLILDVVALLKVSDIEDLTNTLHKVHTIRLKAEQEPCERIRSTIAIGYRFAVSIYGASIAYETIHITSILNESISAMVVDDIKSHLETMSSKYPRESIAEGNRILISWAVAASSSARKLAVSGAAARSESNTRLTEEVKDTGPDNSSVSGQVTRIESCSRQELANRLVISEEFMLRVEAAAKLIDLVARKQMRERERKRVVSSLNVPKAQGSIEAVYFAAGSTCSGNIINSVNRVLAGKSMVQAKRPEIPSRKSTEVLHELG